MTTDNSSIPGKSYLLHILCVVSFYLSLVPDNYFKRLDSYQSGNVDLVSFWSSYQLFSKGENPYSEKELGILQQEKGLGNQRTKLTWNPPWFFLVLSPVLAWSLGKATALMLYFNLVSVLAIGELILGRGRSLRLYILAPLLLFYPVIQVLYFGQSSLAIALLAALAVYGFRANKDLLTGFSLALMTIKPHLVLGFMVTAALFLLLERRFRALMVATATLLVLVLLTSNHLSDWYNTAVLGTQSHALSDWKTATIATPLKTFLAGSEAVRFLIPGLLAVGVLFSVLAGLSLRCNKELALVVSLCISLAFSPYGWDFDSAILIIPMVALIGQWGKKASLIFLLANAMLLIYAFRYARGQESFFFMAAFWGLSMALALVVQSRKAGHLADKSCSTGKGGVGLLPYA